MVGSSRWVVKVWNQDLTQLGNTNFHDPFCYIPSWLSMAWWRQGESSGNWQSTDDGEKRKFGKWVYCWVTLERLWSAGGKGMNTGQGWQAQRRRCVTELTVQRGVKGAQFQTTCELELPPGDLRRAAHIWQLQHLCAHCHIMFGRSFLDGVPWAPLS